MVTDYSQISSISELLLTTTFLIHLSETMWNFADVAINYINNDIITL